MRRRRFLGIAGLGLLGAGAGLGATLDPGGRRVAVTARKFEFVPSEIHATKGERITFEVSATDFAHGFSMPDFGVRADLIPGKPVAVSLVADRTGRFHYLCDNFCGDGHDRMSGLLIVTGG